MDLALHISMNSGVLAESFSLKKAAEGDEKFS